MDIVECLNTMCEAFLEIESEEIKYVQIQESSEGGYDYTLFDLSGEEYDGGIYESQDETKLMGMPCWRFWKIPLNIMNLFGS